MKFAKVLSVECLIQSEILRLLVPSMLARSDTFSSLLRYGFFLSMSWMIRFISSSSTMEKGSDVCSDAGDGFFLRTMPVTIMISTTKHNPAHNQPLAWLAAVRLSSLKHSSQIWDVGLKLKLYLSIGLTPVKIRLPSSAMTGMVMAMASVNGSVW